MTFRHFVERYLDTAVYILMTIILATLVITTVELQGEVRQMRSEIESLREEIAVDIAASEGMGDGHIAGDDVEAQWPRLYSDEDAIALAKLTWGEARGVPDLKINGRVISTRTQQAAVMWTVLNGYSEEHPVEAELLELAYDVLDRWNAEKHGETVARELPSRYLWFHGDGTWNWFRDAYKNGNKWDWSV